MTPEQQFRYSISTTGVWPEIMLNGQDNIAVTACSKVVLASIMARGLHLCLLESNKKDLYHAADTSNASGE